MAGPLTALRRELVSRPIYAKVKAVLPPMSETEREAIGAGTVWWERSLFAGDPDWAALAEHPPAALSREEQAFLDGPVETLCGMVDDWTINNELRDLPPEAWDFMRDKGFFGMIIPKDFGGLGFSAYAHSCVIQKLATRSLTAAVTAMVPNSLGPAELLLLFGTDPQKVYWLPRLASGEEIPCFGLTSEHAGSDAASMIDEGVVCYGDWRGEKVLGIRLTFAKRYITLGPVATVIGLAFKLRDPEGLLRGGEEPGITVALVPADAPGVETGRRHWPAMQAFMNGPVGGTDVFVPLDAIIGGAEMAGRGWQMLMTALAAGRSISLPSLSAGGVKFAARATGAYARIRRQFGIPVGRFEGVEEALGRLAADAYVLDAARRVTCAAIDAGEKPSVLGNVMKYHATERLRASVNAAMDVHGGKGICDGPSNYLAQTYYSLPISITVEGANILTRSMMIFGQGAIRCHPWLLAEMEAAADPDPKAGRAAFDRAFFGHLGHHLACWGRALYRNLGATAPAPEAGPATPYYKAVGRAAASFALVAEMALALLGGALKRKEALSARLGDVFSALYFASCALKRWEEDGRPEADLPVLRYAVERELDAAQTRLEEALHNFPGRTWPWLLRRVVFPWGRWRAPIAHDRVAAAAEVLMQPGAARDRLTAGIYAPAEGDTPAALLDRALAAVLAAEPIEAELDKAGIADAAAGVERRVITADERATVETARALVHRVVAVDDFAPEELTKAEKPRPEPAMGAAPRVAAESG